MAAFIPLIWVVAILWSDARDIAGVATLVLPALILSQQLAVLVVKGRISRKQAALARLSVISLVIMVSYVVNLAR